MAPVAAGDWGWRIVSDQLRRHLIHGQQGFVHLPNSAVNDEQLSFRARGLLAYMLGRPPDWSFNAERLARAGQEGRDAVRAALRELSARGYYRSTKQRVPGAGGRMVFVTVTEVAPTPAAMPVQPPKTGFQPSEDQPSEGQPSEGQRSKSVRPLKTATPTPGAGEVADADINRIRSIRLSLGLPVDRWTATPIRKAVADCVASGHQLAAAMRALELCASDPATRSPARLGCAGPWWTQVERDDLDHRRQLRLAQWERSAADAQAVIDACESCDAWGHLDQDGPAVVCLHGRDEVTSL
jgi:hypothetical protein